MKSKITTFATILIVLTIGLTSCSRQYNLTLIKKNNSANDVAQNTKIQSLQVIEQKKINLVNQSKDMELVNETKPIPTPVIVNQTADLMVTSSIANNESGIDKNLYSDNVKWASYYPEFTNTMNNKGNNSDYGNTNREDFFLYIILAIFLPPVCVGLWEGGFTTDFWISIILTILFWIPGVIFALYIILR
jgi:uncharacterized membrane protein YqaE (UPF0057 family)